MHATKTRLHFLLDVQNLAVDVVKLSNAAENFFIRCCTVTGISQSTEDFLVISAKTELKLGQHLVDGSIVSVNTVVRFRCQLRLSLRVFTYKGLKAVRWRLSGCPGLLP